MSGGADQASTARPGAIRWVALGASLLIAALLLFAAWAKLFTSPEGKLGPIEYAQIAFEAMVALALLALHRRAAMWTIIALLFAGFSGVTAHRLINGYASCGCFGKFTVPPAVTLSADVLILLAAAAIAMAMSKRRAMIGGIVLVPGLALFGAGWAYSESLPSPDDYVASEAQREAGRQLALQKAQEAAGGRELTEEEIAQAVESFDENFGNSATSQLTLLPIVAQSRLGEGGEAPAWMEPLRSAALADADDPALLVFVYDPTCPVCLEYLPAMQAYMHERPDDPTLRVLTVEKSEFEAFDVPDWSWPASPTAALLHAGEIAHEWGGHDTPWPGALRERLETGGAAELQRLRDTYEPLWN